MSLSTLSAAVVFLLCICLAMAARLCRVSGGPWRKLAQISGGGSSAGSSREAPA